MAVRVYELAKELGLESKELLSTLNDMGSRAAAAGAGGLAAMPGLAPFAGMVPSLKGIGDGAGSSFSLLFFVFLIF